MEEKRNEIDTRAGLRSKIMKIFQQPNFFRAFPVIVAPALGYAILMTFIITFFLPELFEIQIQDDISFVLTPIAAMVGLLILRVLFRDSLYFRMSAYMVLLALVIAMLATLDNYLGQTTGLTIITIPTAVIFGILIVVYTINSVAVPIGILKEENKKVASGKLVINNNSLSLYGKEFADLEKAFQTMVTSFASIIHNIQLVSASLANNSEEFASSTEELSSSSEEISSVIQQMNRGAQQQAEQINLAVSNVEDLSMIVEKITQDIASTADVISDVANQTNMLSLNAQIEAARAGDFGKSFMVVADNVRRLAEDTKTNSNNIANLISNIQNQISTSVEKIANTVDSVAAVTEETAASSEEVAVATEEQATIMEVMSDSSQNLALLAQDLTNLISTFELKEEQVGLRK
ncbi:MAG: methyl-accepting chemotaxis protein [Candidatus Hodarchaeales archaeon]|jgi:methyl-accepting chemotaxis protein